MSTGGRRAWRSQALRRDATGASTQHHVWLRRLVVAAVAAPLVALSLAGLAGAARASAQTVTTTIGVGSGPDAVAVSPSGDTLYVANEASNTVSVIDTATNQAMGGRSYVPEPPVVHSATG
jgi:DNA-binding beta-propeller fold protein YncE